MSTGSSAATPPPNSAATNRRQETTRRSSPPTTSRPHCRPASAPGWPRRWARPGSDMVANELLWCSTRELAVRISAKDIFSRTAPEAHLERIDEVNPVINAVVTRDDEAAFAQAEAADAATARGESLGALHGVPMTHKDTHDTAGMRTTWGSPLMAEHVPETDSLIIA